MGLQETLDGLMPSASNETKSKTAIVVTHHLQDLRRASHILYLEDGKIVEQGTFDALVENGGVFANQVAAGLGSNDEQKASSFQSTHKELNEKSTSGKQSRSIVSCLG